LHCRRREHRRAVRPAAGRGRTPDLCRPRHPLGVSAPGDLPGRGAGRSRRRSPRWPGMSILYRASGPVTLVGGGPVEDGMLAEALALAPEAVGADGGGDVILPGGYRFAAVIGDLDSIRDADRLRAAGVPVHRIPEQD